MKNRNLTTVEKKMSESSIFRIEDELEWLEYQKKVITNDLNSGLRLKFKRAVRDQKYNLKEIESNITLHQNTIQELKKQIKEGVEVKGEKEDDNI